MVSTTHLVVAAFALQACVMFLIIQQRERGAPSHHIRSQRVAVSDAHNMAALSSQPLHVSVSNAPAQPPYRVYQSPRVVRPDFQQVGFVYSDDKSLHIPLYGRPAPRNPNRFQYYTRSNSADISVGVRSGGRDCMSDIGCEELQSDDLVTAEELTDTSLRVKIYDRASP